MSRWRLLLFAVLLSFIAVSNPLFAQSDNTVPSVPNIVKFSGTLQNVNTPALVGITFALYKDQHGGAPLWLETQNVSVDEKGNFTVSLGANHPGGLPLEFFTAGQVQWLGMQAENTPEQDRVLLASVPYAAKAADAETLGGKPLSAFVLAASGGTQITPTPASDAFVRDPAFTPAATAAAAWVPNYIPRFLDATTLTNSTLIDTGGKIGINTASPETLLDVVANSGQMVKIGNVPWAFRFGSLQSGTQFIGIAVKKTAANNNYIASSADIATVNHTVMEFNYDGSWRIKQQAHQTDGTILNLQPTLSLTNTGNFGVGVATPAQKMEVTGNIKINGTGNGVLFPDGTSLKSATPVLTGISAGTGLTGGGTSGSPSVSLDTQFTDARYAGLAAANSFNADQTFNKSVIVKGAVVTGTQDITGSVKIHGNGNGIVFPDGSVQTSAVAQGSQPNIMAGDGVVVAGTAATPIIGLNVNYTDARYAGISAGQNTFYGDQVFNRSVSIAGPLASGAQTVTGDVTASGNVSATTVQAHVGASVPGGIAISATADAEDGTALNVVENGVTGSTTGIHSTVYSSTGYAGIFDNLGQGSILLGRVKIADYWVRRFRVDGSGRVYANNGYATGGADFAESFAVEGRKSAYEPGDVLVIDPSAVRRLTTTAQPYSTLVAGVYSTKPGVIASPYDIDNERKLDEEVPLAVVGVVPCKVSTENGPIAIGDLLVTATIPGYAMKGTDRTRMMGAVVGKALQSLDSGTDIIQILVSLQ